MSEMDGILSKVVSKMDDYKETRRSDVPKLFFGIDPGWTGGFAAVDQWGQFVHAFSFKKMTETDVVKDIWAWLGPKLEEEYRPTFCVVEKVHAMPKQGVSSTFKFGWQFGLVRSAVILSEVAWDEVRPAKWQKKLKCRTGGDKGVALARAQQLWPDVDMNKTGYKAFYDALLLADYGRRLHLGLEF